MHSGNTYKLYKTHVVVNIVCASGRFNVSFDKEDLGKICEREHWTINSRGDVVSGRTRMSRLVMNAQKDDKVHFKDGNKLNLQKYNLFIDKKPKHDLGKTSSTPGVSYDWRRNKYRAYTTTKKNRKWLGWFKTEEEAKNILQTYLT